MLESRLSTESSAVRRRRECEACHKRFTTFERVEAFQLLIVKTSGEREPYSVQKLRDGVSRACAKTTVTAEQIDSLLETIEAELLGNGKKELPSKLLGEMVLNRLKDLNEVAYVRFASVYRQFQSIEDFISELENLHEAGGVARP
ncbi:MAG: transcriptional regulator NrdR [Candidatus Obscuribacterales bacterium]|nr:transcriptional regulator NrdR [Candidatus Obscuribacterales bacterium]